MRSNFGAIDPDPALNNVGNNGTFNQFEGMGGNDTITGNGNTRIAFYSASAGVTVDLAAGTAQGSAAGDVALIGHDHIIGGVNSVGGSQFGDVIRATRTTTPSTGRAATTRSTARGAAIPSLAASAMM